MLMFGFRGVAESDESVQRVMREISEYKLGCVVLFGYNVQSPEQVQSLNNALKRTADDLLIAIDQEGGKVQRLNANNGFFHTESADYIARNLSYQQAYEAYFKMAGMLKNIGVSVNFGPCVDMDTLNSCRIIGGLGRSYSQDPEIVIEYARAFIESHKANDILPVLKHFPGHGFAQGDTHEGLTDVTDVANPDIELAPYKALLSQYHPLAVMSAHVINRNLDEMGVPATLSSKIIAGMLREQLGFQGVVITDALEMGAIRKYYTLQDIIVMAINAGNDILMFARNAASSLDAQKQSAWDINPEQVVNIVISAISQGAIAEHRIEESYNRIQNLKLFVHK